MICLGLSASEFVCLHPERGFPCIFNGKRLSHGSIRGSVKCIHGSIINSVCRVEELALFHGDNITMKDGIERRCDNGTMKPHECKF